MDKEKLEQIIYALIDKFDIKKKVGYRASVLKHYDENKDKDMDLLISDLIRVTIDFKKEELNES